MDDGLMSPEELDALEEEILANTEPEPLDMERGRLNEVDGVQGCASCGYNPDACGPGCDRYPTDL